MESPWSKPINKWCGSAWWLQSIMRLNRKRKLKQNHYSNYSALRVQQGLTVLNSWFWYKSCPARRRLSGYSSVASVESWRICLEPVQSTDPAFITHRLNVDPFVPPNSRSRGNQQNHTWRPWRKKWKNWSRRAKRYSLLSGCSSGKQGKMGSEGSSWRVFLPKGSFPNT